MTVSVPQLLGEQFALWFSTEAYGGRTAYDAYVITEERGMPRGLQVYIYLCLYKNPWSNVHLIFTYKI